jgi:hypothetical protein
VTNPHLSSGVFSQKYWPGVGDVDDCWAMAALLAVHAVAPWVSLPKMTDYRAAAGNPDKPGPTGGSLAHSAKAIRTLWPELGRLIKVIDNAPSDAFNDAKKLDRVASVSVLSGALPPSLIFNFYLNHRITVFRGNSGWLAANPLAPPHSRWKPITKAALKLAMEKYPTSGVNAIVMPSVAAAFKTHPLYP